MLSGFLKGTKDQLNSYEDLAAIDALAHVVEITCVVVRRTPQVLCQN